MSKFKNDENRRRVDSAKRNGLALGVILIAAGLVIVGRNTGVIDPGLYRVLISWPMLLVLLGVMLAAGRNYMGGFIVAAVGAYFLIPRITGAGPEWFAMYKPVLLIFLGIMIILKIFLPARNHRHRPGGPTRHATGFVESDSVFGSHEHIVLDEEFKGASLKGTFSGTVLDLRHTTLPEGETYIDVQCTFAGIELFVPRDWEVVSEVRAILGGVDDKRYGKYETVIPGRKLVVRGNMSFAGIEIKS